MSGRPNTKVAKTMYKRHGRDIYRRIGRLGGLKGKADGVIKGFDANRALASEAGSVGGRISKRGKAKK